MNSLNFHYLACNSFSKKFVRSYFTTSNIIKGFFIGLLLSIFLFFHYFGLEFWLFYLVPTFFGFFYLLDKNHTIFFWSGFFVGLFWFYWISFSFIHYGFPYLMPLGILGVCIGVGILFLLSAIFCENIFVKAILLILITQFIHPFGFNWLDFRIMLLNTPLRVDIFGLFALVLSASVLIYCKKYWKILSLPILLLGINLNTQKPNILPFEVALTNTFIPQDEKWKPHLIQNYINENVKKIDKAIKNKKRAIIFPESAFPLYLNKAPKIANYLKEKSNEIAIITGALTVKGRDFYNSTYVFDKGKMQIYDKVILVPFGEEVPLPNFMKTWINDIFYDGAKDFSTAKNPQDYTIDNIKIRNAVCFEATTSRLYEGKPKFMIAISNNAWFTPSTEPLLQHLLLKLHATLNNTTIYHSVNGSKSEVIYPWLGAFGG